jgi:formimidoylglutamate deiminase
VVFGGNRPLVRETHVAGHRVVAEGRHRDGEAIAARYRRVLAGLLD